MDIEINYQKIIKKLKIRLFKCERYFEYFKSFLLSLNFPDENSTKKSKVYTLIQSKHSLQKKPKLIFWSSIYLMFQKPSFEYPNELNILEEKYLHYYSQYIFKFLCSLSDIYSAEINILKQEYLNLCIKFINQIKNKRIKTLRIRNNSLKHFLYESRNKDKFKNENNNENKDNEKSSEDDDDDNVKNNKYKYGDNKRPKTLIEKELFKLKLKSSNEVVDEFIGDINNDLLINKKKEICFLHFIKTRKNKIFRRYLSNQTRKNLDEMNKNDLLYTKTKDKFDSIFTLEMKIKNQNYRNSKKKKEIINLKFNNKTTNNDDNKNLFKDKNKNYSRFALKKNIMMNISDKNKFIYKNNQNNLPKCFSFKLKTKNKLLLPLLPKEENPVLKTEKYNNIINQKYYINGSDLFY